MFKKKSINSIEVDSLKIKDKDQAPSGFFTGGVWYHPERKVESEESRNFVRFGRKKWSDDSPSDDDLLQIVCEKIIETKFVKDKDIKLSVTNGRVFLSGRIDNNDCKQILEEVIKGIPGVRDLVNDLWVES